MNLDELRDLLGTKPFRRAGIRRVRFGSAPSNDNASPRAEWYPPLGPQPVTISADGEHAFRGEPLESAISLRKIPISSLGYDNRGRYFGTGDPIWEATTSMGQLDFRVRAPNRAAAKERIRKLYPYARFLR